MTVLAWSRALLDIPMRANLKTALTDDGKGRYISRILDESKPVANVVCCDWRYATGQGSVGKGPPGLQTSIMIDSGVFKHFDAVDYSASGIQYLLFIGSVSEGIDPFIFFIDPTRADTVNLADSVLAWIRRVDHTIF